MTAGTTIQAEKTLNITTNNLKVASVQNSSKSRSNSQGMSAGFNAGGLSSLGANQAAAHARKKETLQTTLLGNEVNIDTTKQTDIQGATIAAVNAQGEDNGKLHLKTETLAVSSLNNTDNSKSTSMAAQAGGSYKNNNVNSLSLEYANNTHNSKTKTLASLGSGDIQIANKANSDTTMLNRDITNNTVDIYNISSHKGLKGELDTRFVTKDGRKAIAKDFKETGKNVQIIAKGLPEANNKNIIIASIGKGLDKLSGITGGILPSNKSNGGLLGNIPVMLGDNDINHKIIQVVTADSLYAKNNKENFMPIEKSDYYKAADKKTQNALRAKGILISKHPVTIDKANATYQNFTNGMLNDEALAIKNAIDQTASKIVTINYNPTHGFFGDALESGVDKAGLGTTGIAKQTGTFINDVTTARAKEGSNFAAHSQGNLLTKSGIEYQKEHGGFMDRSYFINDEYNINDKRRERAIPTFAGYGSPVNTKDMDDVIGVHGINYNYKGMYTKNNDAVGEFLGNNKGDNQLNPQRSIFQTGENLIKLFGDESPHSTYDCRSNPKAMCGARAW